jgi:hypothetical protein
MRTLTVLMALILMGCASPLKGASFNRGSTTPEEFDKNVAACEMEAEKHRVTGADKIQAAERYNTMMDVCMRSKGFGRKK